MTHRIVASAQESATRTLGLHNAYSSAVDMIWNGNVPGAINALTPLAARFPRASVHLGEAYMIGSWISGSKTDSPKMLAAFKGASKLAQKYIDGFPTRAKKDGLLPEGCTPEQEQAFLIDLRLVKADATFFAGCELIRVGSMVKGGWKSRKAWVMYSDLLKKAEHSVLSDEVLFGVGCYLLLLSRLPDTVLRILEVVGFEGNRIQGISNLIKAFYGGGVRSPFAGLLLLINLVVLPRQLGDSDTSLSEADALLSSTLARWPNGPYFHWLESFGARKRGDNVKAIASIDLAIAAAGEEHSSSFRFDRATIQFADLRWDDALKSLEPVCHDTNNEHYPTALVISAACHEMSGRHKQAAEILARVPTSGVTPKETNMVELAKLCRKRTTGTALVPFELLFTRRDVAHMSEENARTLMVALEDMWASHSEEADKEERALYQLLHAVMLTASGEKEAGEALLRKAVAASHGLKKEKHVQPFAEFELAELLYNSGDLTGAEELMRSCAGISGFCFEDQLKTRVRFALDQVKQQLKSSGVPLRSTK